MALVLALQGCATVRPDAARPVSAAWLRPDETALAAAYAPQLRAGTGLSGLHVLSRGADALVVRAALAEAAQHTLDLQYYIVRDDTTTQLLMARVLRAAQRGVRVRLLVDDLDAAGKDLDLAALAAFERIEVRVFNPFKTRGAFGLSQLVEFIGSPRRLHRRMHNKLWIADNAVAVAGGRNLGDEYFDAASDLRFTDLDLLVAGAAVPELSGSFDAYWNSSWAVPIQAFVPLPGPQERLRFEQALRQRVEGFRDGAFARALRSSGLGPATRSGQLPLTVAPVQVFADPPEKVDPDAEASDPTFSQRIRPAVQQARSELLLISPYVIPSEDGLQALAALRRRGVRVRVLTNSLATADTVPLAHAGYARHRERLLAAGVELHEMQPEPSPSTHDAAGSSAANHLHTKAIVVDRRWVVVGSMNLDPRSRLSNTEVGMLIDSEHLGQSIGQIFDSAVLPSRAFRVLPAPPSRTGAEWNDAAPGLRWIAEVDGRPVQHDTEPATGFWRRLLAWLLGAVAPESLL